MARESRVPELARDFSLLHSAQTVSEAHSNSYPVGKGDISPGVKATGALSWLLTSI
jgi:hypothetical protein